jgi:hypothetical protein
LAGKGEEETIDVSIGTLDETILRSDSSVIPWRYAWYTDVLGWMKKILPAENEIQKLEPQ